MAIDTGELQRAIGEKKLIIEDKYALVQVAAKKASERYKELLKAEEKRDLRNGSKEISRHEMAEESFKLAVKEYFYFSDNYNSLVEAVISLYENLIASESPRGAKKALAEAKRFEEKERYRYDKIKSSVANIEGIDELYADYVSDKNKISKAEEIPQKTDMKNEMNTERFDGTGSVSSYRENLQTPRASEDSVSVDITAIIENAVASAMDKFNAVLEMRTNKMLENEAEKNAPELSSSSASEDILKMHSEIVGFELEIAAKLSVLTQRLKSLSEELIDIGVSCIELSNTQKETAEKQQKTAEMQSALLLGVTETLSKQKQTFEEYSLSSSEQAALLEAQRSNTENQAKLAESQKELNQLQKSITEAHAELADASGEIFESQKKLTEMQYSVMTAQSKNLEQQRALTEKQAEISALQKVAYSEHKDVKKKLKKTVF